MADDAPEIDGGEGGEVLPPAKKKRASRKKLTLFQEIGALFAKLGKLRAEETKVTSQLSEKFNELTTGFLLDESNIDFAVKNKKKKETSYQTNLERGAPKKPGNGYIFFVQEMTKALPEDTPKTGLMKHMGEEWKKCEDKSPYYQMAKEAKEKYEADYKKWLEENPDAEAPPSFKSSSSSSSSSSAAPDVGMSEEEERLARKAAKKAAKKAKRKAEEAAAGGSADGESKKKKKKKTKQLGE